nr:acetoacetate decarboxylase family protein [Petropleomorpha daqingensis]
MPVYYHDDEFMASLHTASYDAVAAALPCDQLRPARWIDGRALLSLGVFRYRETTCVGADGGTEVLTPYAEVSVAVVVTVGPARRVLPILSPRLRVFVLHLPVTTLEARDVGALWGFPKFVADLDFEEEPDRRRVVLSEDGQEILDLILRPSGPALADRHPHVVHTVKDGVLLETTVPMSGYRQIRLGPASGTLRLGEHPVGRQLRGWEISPAPLAVFNYLTHRTILPEGRPIGPGRQYRGYVGSDRPRGRYTVRYPDTPPIDQYAADSATGAVGPSPAAR